MMSDLLDTCVLARGCTRVLVTSVARYALKRVPILKSRYLVSRPRTHCGDWNSSAPLISG